jgi:hypothetical protein
MMLDPFRVPFRHAVWNSKGTKKCDDGLVTAFAGDREMAAFLGEENRPVRLRRDQFRLLQSRDGPVYGHVRYTESFGQVNNSRFSSLGYQVGNRFHVIFSYFAGVLPACLGKIRSLASSARGDRFLRRGFLCSRH